MYKFNFLAKINKEKQELKKRNRLVALVFVSSTICIVLLLGILYTNSLIIGSTYKDFSRQKANIEEKSREFRKSGFFSYRNIQNVYNTVTGRKKMTTVIDAVESALDSTVIVTNFKLSDDLLETILVAKISGSRSQLMNIANGIKDKINENLLSINYSEEKDPVTLSRFPDIKSEINGLQYWEFKIDIKMKNAVDKAPETEDVENPDEMNT